MTASEYPERDVEIAEPVPLHTIQSVSHSLSFYGLVTGTGPDQAAACAALRDDARRLARQIAADMLGMAAAAAARPNRRPPRGSWRVMVVGVRFAIAAAPLPDLPLPPPPPGTHPSLLPPISWKPADPMYFAYGTLASADVPCLITYD
jgi:hypothetical protein